MTSFEASALDLLLQRLTWPSGLVRERACIALGSLIADPNLGAEVADALLTWMARQQLESVAIFALLTFFQAKSDGFSIPAWDAFSRRLSKPSLLSWLMVRSLYGEYVGDPPISQMHSGTAPRAFEVNPFFHRYAEAFVPPVYLERAKYISGKRCSGFLRQWTFEWTNLVELTGFKLRMPYIDFWMRQDDDHLGCLDLPLSEVYRSAFLRALAWAVDDDAIPRRDAVWLSAQTCPVDLGLWQVRPGKQPDDWPNGGVIRDTVDTLPGNVASELDQMWRRRLGDEWLVAGASGRVQENSGSAYDLEIIGVIQACNGANAPAMDTLCAEDAGHTIAEDAEDLLVFGGRYRRQRGEDWRERYSDWVIWRLATLASPNAVPRWQWWRFRRGVWLPSPFLALKSFEFRCTPEAVIVEEDGRSVARWTDWTHNLREMTTADLTPSSGQMLLVHRSLIEREAAKLGGVFAWICRIATYHRKYSHTAFTETDFTLDFGTTRIVRDGTDDD